MLKRWEATPAVNEIIDAEGRFKVICAGRRFGKTVMSLMWLLDGSLQPHERRWFVAPTYRQGRMIVLPLLRQIAREIEGARLYESELTVRFHNGAELSVKGSDNEDSLRGAGLGMDGSNALVMDEYAMMKPHVWQEIMYPMLTSTKSKALFIGTPDGFGNGFYDMFMRGQDENEKDWASWQYTTIQGGWVDPEEIENARKTMDEPLFKQEFEASFESLQNRCAYNFDRRSHCTKEAEESPNMIAGMDFNVGKMACVFAYEYTDGSVHYFDEICLRNSNTEEMVRVMRQRYPTCKYVYPDPAGKARSTTSSRSDHAILRENGFVVKARKSHPSHRDRLASLNRKLKDATGEITMTVDPKCVELIRDLEQCVRDEKGGIEKKDLERTHFLDACSYYIEFKYPVTVSRAYSTNW